MLKELFRNGYRFERNAKSGNGVIYRNPDTGSEAELYRYLAKAVAKRERRERLLCCERRLLERLFDDPRVRRTMRGAWRFDAA